MEIGIIVFLGIFSFANPMDVTDIDLYFSSNLRNIPIRLKYRI